MKRILLASIWFALIAIAPAFSQDDPKSDKPDGPAPKGEVATSKGSLHIDGKVLNYTIEAGTLQLRDEENDPIALFGFTAYFKDGVTDYSKRPIIFAYNGGPGSSSIWLHMGVMGPKRVAVNDVGYTPAAPYNLEENPNSPLDLADIVMIDPVGTGLSHAIGKAKNTDFWGVDEDIRTVSLFIKQFVNEHNRWNAPKYLLGESYGTMRNAGVMNYLQERLGMSLNGVIMVSAVFDIRMLAFSAGDDISYITNLPTYAATAWYHDKVPGKPELAKFLQDARDFAGGAYATALMKGDQLQGGERKEILTKLAYFTGLTEDYLSRADLRVRQGEFSQQLLRDQGITVGRLDSRFTGINQDLLSQNTQYDPQSASISPGYTAAFMDYFYNQLGVDKSNYYHVSAYARKGFNWKWEHRSGRGFPSGSTNSGVDMAEAMSHNPNLKVLIMNGYYDLATPFYNVEYTINHLGLTPEIKKNIEMKYYEAGHMMYTHEESLKMFKKDLASFIDSTLHPVTQP